MTRVRDQYDLLPELFISSDDFVKVEWWEDHDVDIQPCQDDTMLSSDVLTVFINTEPDRDNAADGAFDTIRSMRPNNIFLVGEIDNQSWPFPTIFYPSFLKETLRINNEFRYTIGEKKFLADALLGGMSSTKTNYRNNIVIELENQGLLEDCLVNLKPRFLNDVRPGHRSPALDELDDPDFMGKPTSNGGEKTFYTMVPTDDCGFGQSRYLSQIIPHGVYDATYVSLVAETETEYGGFCVSEKISKPLTSGKPFMLFGAPGYLQALRDIGFKTFDRWWSEDYDAIHDPEKRIQAIVKALISFNSLPTENKINYIEEMKTVTDHNRQWCQSDKFIIEVRKEIKRRLDEQ